MHDDGGRNDHDAGGRRRDPAPTQEEILHAWRWAGGMQPPYPGHWAVRETQSGAGTLVCCGEPMDPILREPDWRPDIPGPV